VVASEAGWKGMPGWRSDLPESRMAAPQLAIPEDQRFATRKAKRSGQTSVKRQRRHASSTDDSREGRPLEIISQRGSLHHPAVEGVIDAPKMETSMARRVIGPLHASRTIAIARTGQFNYGSGISYLSVALLCTSTWAGSYSTAAESTGNCYLHCSSRISPTSPTLSKPTYKLKS
jgi:hypothetical protein